MDDLIRRQAALSTIEKMYKMCEGNLSDYHDLLVACFTDLTPAQRWISCKTAFPEKENTRVTYQTNAGVIIIDGIYGGIDAYGHRVWRDREHWLCYWDDEVVAWMPIVIPKPWKGEEHGTSRAVLSQKPVR